jgi:hypothetical protein
MSQATVGAVNAAQKCRALILPLKIWNPPPALLDLLSNDDQTTKALELSPKVSRNLILHLHHLSHNQERKAPLCYRPAASRSALMPGLRQIAPGNTQHHSVAFHLRLTHPSKTGSRKGRRTGNTIARVRLAMSNNAAVSTLPDTSADQPSWCRLYCGHVVMAFPSFHAATNSWVAQADVSWCHGAKRKSEFLRFALRTKTETEAVCAALNNSIAWIDERIRTNGGHNSRSDL